MPWIKIKEITVFRLFSSIYNYFTESKPTPDPYEEAATKLYVIDYFDKNTQQWRKFDCRSVLMGVLADWSTLLAARAMNDKENELYEVKIEDNTYSIIKCFGKTVVIAPVGSDLNDMSRGAGRMNLHFPNLKFMSSLGLASGCIPTKKPSVAMSRYIATKELLEKNKQQLPGIEQELKIKDKEWQGAQAKAELKEKELKAAESQGTLTKLQMIELKSQFYDAQKDSAKKEMSVEETRIKIKDLQRDIDFQTSQLSDLEFECAREAKLDALIDKKAEEDAQLQYGDVVISSRQGVVKMDRDSGEISHSPGVRLPGTAWLRAAQSVKIESKTADPLIKNIEHISPAWQKLKGPGSTRSPRVFESVIPELRGFGKDPDKIEQHCKNIGALCIDSGATGLAIGEESYIIIRGINQPIAGKKSDFNWDNLAAYSAAGYLRALLSHITSAPEFALFPSRGFSLGVIASHSYIRDQVEALFVNKLNESPVKLPEEDKNVWSFGQIGKRNVVMISPATNTDITQDTIAQMADQLRSAFPEIEKVACLGFASIASPEQCRVGDVAVSKGFGVINFDVVSDGKEMKIIEGRRANPPGTLWLQVIVAEEVFGKDKSDYRVINGLIGCSHQAVSDARVREAVYAKTKVVALDTESAGLANGDQGLYVMIKGLVDLADGKSSADEKLLQMTARNVAKYLESLILTLPNNLNNDLTFWPRLKAQEKRKQAERKVEQHEVKEQKSHRMA